MDYRAAASLLRSWDRILILTHKRPDGDTIGCAVGLCALLRQVGKTAWVLPAPDAIPLLADCLRGWEAPADARWDKVVTVDVAALGLLGPQARAIADTHGVDLAIDHHASNEGFGRENCVEADKAACGEIIYAIALELLGDRPLPQSIALPLYVAVSTDTGCFVYPNTTPNTHRVAAALMATGIDFSGVNQAHFRTKSFKRLKLESLLVEGMERYDNGETAVVFLPLSMLDALGITEADTDNISSFAGQTEGVRTAVTLREYPGGEIRVSVRTTGGLDASKVCALLGGGGHVGAAGATFHGPMSEARTAILDAIRQVQHG